MICLVFVFAYGFDIIRYEWLILNYKGNASIRFDSIRLDWIRIRSCSMRQEQNSVGVFKEPPRTYVAGCNRVTIVLSKCLFFFFLVSFREFAKDRKLLSISKCRFRCQWMTQFLVSKSKSVSVSVSILLPVPVGLSQGMCQIITSTSTSTLRKKERKK